MCRCRLPPPAWPRPAAVVRSAPSLPSMLFSVQYSRRIPLSDLSEHCVSDSSCLESCGAVGRPHDAHRQRRLETLQPAVHIVCKHRAGDAQIRNLRIRDHDAMRGIASEVRNDRAQRLVAVLQKTLAPRGDADDVDGLDARTAIRRIEAQLLSDAEARGADHSAFRLRLRGRLRGYDARVHLYDS